MKIHSQKKTRNPRRRLPLAARLAAAGILAAWLAGAAWAASPPGVVLGATARDANQDNNHFLFGATVTQVVGIAGDYAGIGSRVTGVDNPSQPDDFLGSTATILAGANTGAQPAVISFGWRNRTDLERDGMAFPSWGHHGMDHFYMDGGGSGREGVALAYDAYNVISDVVDLGGVNGIYVLQMEYDEDSIFHGHRPDLTSAELEPIFQSKGRLFLGWLEADGLGQAVPDAEIGVPKLLDYDEWCNANAGNSAVGGSAVMNYDGTWQEFLLDHPGAETNMVDYLGSWGVDIDMDLAWGILDHNSQFGVVPEPATLSLLALGGLVVMRRRLAADPKM